MKKALFIHGLHSDSESTTGGIAAAINTPVQFSPPMAIPGVNA